MNTNGKERGRFRAFNEKYLVEVRPLSLRDRRNLYIWAITLAAVGLISFFVILAAVVQRDSVSVIDRPLEQGLDSIRTGWLTTVMIVLATVFGPIALPIIILVVTVLWMVISKRLWRPLLLAAGTLTGVIVVQLIAHAVQRSRPPVALMLFGPDLTFSFPSGHVMGASNFLLLTTYLIFSRSKFTRRAVIAFVIAGVGIVVIAACRVYLGYHWATDALASVSLSLVIVGIVIVIDTWRTVRVR